jgi:hypothetical protein
MRRVPKNKKSNYISFTTPEKERKERVGEAIELYKACMLDLEKEESEAVERVMVSLLERLTEEISDGCHLSLNSTMRGILNTEVFKK